MGKLLNKLKFKIIKFPGIIIITGIVIFIGLKINKRTNLLRKFLKTGDHVRFYIGEISQTGIVDKVYYIGNVKTAKIHYCDEFFERPVTEIYLSLR